MGQPFSDKWLDRIPTLQSETMKYYRHHKRSLPWRDNLDQSSREMRFYQVLVSEYMLQQTQVARVVPHYNSWMNMFPNISAVSDARLADVLRSWQGLGYNRRAKYLYEVCCALTSLPLPKDFRTLDNYKGIGRNTAAAIAVYTDNVREVFVETNVRTVVAEHILHDYEGPANDTLLLEIMEYCTPYDDVKNWYWALMDYGSYLKTFRKNYLAIKTSKQSRFEGSRRQLRGFVLRELSARDYASEDELSRVISDNRLSSVLTELETEGLIQRTSKGVSLHGVVLYNGQVI